MNIILIAIGLLTGIVFAKTLGETALSYSPNGKIVQEKQDEVKIQGDKGGVVEIEFADNGDFEEASGHFADKDQFSPPHGLVSLAKALEAVKKANKSASGKWTLDKSFLNGWHYEFEGYENGNEMEYTVDAKTGKYVSAQLD